MIKSFIMNYLNRQTLKNSVKVELSIGIVYLKPLTNGMVNKCRAKSCIASNLLNDAYFFQLMDYEMTNLSKKQVDNLSVEDGSVLRLAVKNVLLKNKVVKVDGASNSEDFSAEDISIIEHMKTDAKNDLNKLFDETGYKVPGLEVE